MALKNLEDHDHFEISENQTKATQEHRLKSQNTTQINTERDSIAYTLKNAAEFTDEEKQKRFETLAEGIDDTDLSEIRAFKQKIDSERQEIRGMIELYTSTINKNRDIFGVDSNRGLNAADQYLKEFMELPLEEKKQWLSKIETDIKERVELYRRAKELMPDKEEMIRTMRRSELQELLKKSEAFLTEAETIFKNNKELFTDEEKQEYIDQLSDSTRSDQAQIINRISLEIGERRNLLTTYGKIPSKYKQFTAGFEKMSFEERKISIEKTEAAVTKDYRDQQRNHPLAKHVSEASKDDAYKYFQGASLEKKFEALNMLESQFQFEKGLSDDYEALLGKLDKHEKSTTIDRLRIDFYKAKFEDKEQKLIPELKEKVKQAETSVEEENKLDKEYEAKLDNALKNKYISKKTKERSTKLWNEESIQYKRDTNNPDKFDKLMAPRIALFERFKALPNETQDSNKEFFEAGHLRRLQIINKLEENLSLKDKETPKDSDKKGEKEKAMINAAMNSQEIMEERDHYTIVSAAAEETKLSENQHNKIEASKRQDDAENKEMAQSLEKYSDGTFVLNSKGAAEEIVEIDIDKTMNSDEKAALKRTIVNGVIKSSNPTAAKNIQFKNQKGQEISATAGKEKVQQMEEKMKDTVADKVIEMAKRRRMNIDEEKIKDKIENTDFEKVDIAA